MKLKRARITWDHGVVLVEKVGGEDRGFMYSGGGCFADVQKMNTEQAELYLYALFVRLTKGYGIPARRVYAEFMKISEFKKAYERDYY